MLVPIEEEKEEYYRIYNNDSDDMNIIGDKFNKYDEDNEINE